MPASRHGGIPSPRRIRTVETRGIVDETGGNELPDDASAVHARASRARKPSFGTFAGLCSSGLATADATSVANVADVHLNPY